MAGKNLKKGKRIPIQKTVEPFTLPTISFIKGPSRILVLMFTNTSSLSSSLRRVHDHYEGGRLRGPILGINMPFNVLYNFVFSIGLHRLDPEERELWNVIGGFDSSYVIAYLKGDTSSLLHEYAHAVYYLDSSYRHLVSELWETLTKACKVAIGKELTIRNYKEDVWVDEWQAYTCESSREFGKKWSEELSESHRLLKARLGRPVVEDCSTN
jgi:hypothetical protein